MLDELLADISLQYLNGLPVNESFVISPLSILTILGTILAGTDGISKENIEKSFFKDSTQYEVFVRNKLIYLKNPINYEDIYLRTYVWPPWILETRWIVLPDIPISIKDSFIAEIRNDYFAEVILMQEYKLATTIKKLRKIIGIVAAEAFKKFKDAYYSNINNNEAAAVFGLAHFNGRWQEPFDRAKNHTFEQDHFNPPGGAPKMMDFISAEEWRPYYKEDNFTMVSRPYYNHLHFNVLLPEMNRTLESVLKNLSGERLTECLNNVIRKPQENYTLIDLKIPKFNLFSKIDVVPFFKKLGIYPVFYPHLANFSRMVTGTNMYIDNAEHVVSFSNDEYGSNAEDVILGYDFPSEPRKFKKKPPVPVHLNRPFAFFITYGTQIVFAGKMNG